MQWGGVIENEGLARGLDGGLGEKGCGLMFGRSYQSEMFIASFDHT
jgi:hypothetical protein